MKHVYTLLSPDCGDHNIFTMWHKYSTPIENISTKENNNTRQLYSISIIRSMKKKILTKRETKILSQE